MGRFQSYSGCLLPRDLAEQGSRLVLAHCFNPTQDACSLATGCRLRLVNTCHFCFNSTEFSHFHSTRSFYFLCRVSILLRMLFPSRLPTQFLFLCLHARFQSYSGCLLPRDTLQPCS